MRVLTKKEQMSVVGGLLPAPGEGGGGGSGGGYTGGSPCITNAQAANLVAISKNVGEATFGTLGAAFAAVATEGYSAAIQATSGTFSVTEMSKIGSYAGEQFANNEATSWDDVVNTVNYIQGLWSADHGGTVALSWYNYSYEDACNYTGDSSN